jgi:hypothetical protein
MMKKINLAPLSFFLVIVCFSISACSKDDIKEKPYVLITATGDIQAELNTFRSLVGEKINTTPGVKGGRREINWDGIPDQLLNTKIPENFFNPTAPGSPVQNQRGLVYSSIGELRVSDNGFADVNPSAAGSFTPFSGNKTFSNISARLWDVGFQIAGQPQEAKVKGFGIVFSDVDLANKTFLEFFADDKSLGKFFVPPHDNNTNFSFLGVYFNAPVVTRIRVGHDGVIAEEKNDISNGGPEDLVVMDDFIYSEPEK